MKRNAPSHPKVDVLRSMLGLRKFQAVGLLELLWHFTAQYSPRGDIGKHTNSHIAAFLDWPQKKADELILALIESGWLEKNDEFRLVVHDWHTHSDDICDKYLARAGLVYANGHETRRANDRTRADKGDHDRPKPPMTAHDRPLPPTRARPESEPETESEAEGENTPAAAFQILKTVPEMAWLTPEIWQGVRKHVSGHPMFSFFNWPAFARWARDEAVIEPKATTERGRWLRWKISDWIQGKTGSAAAKISGADSNPSAPPPVPFVMVMED